MRQFIVLFLAALSLTSFAQTDTGDIDLPQNAQQVQALSVEVGNEEQANANYYKKAGMGQTLSASFQYHNCVTTCNQNQAPTADCLAQCQAAYIPAADSDVPAVNNADGSAPSGVGCYHQVDQTTTQANGTDGTIVRYVDPNNPGQMQNQNCGGRASYQDGTPNTTDSIIYDNSAKEAPSAIPSTSDGPHPQNGSNTKYAPNNQGATDYAASSFLDQ